ncbi:MAG: RNA-binding protein [Gammaproteobacteria bacterium]|nr:RNA-binding protein [Gammaproteobacteria bacterium]RPG27131.1 MAG: CRTAC1 family protein [Gammaproteobacteria bacterium TMED50]
MSDSPGRPDVIEEDEGDESAIRRALWWSTGVLATVALITIAVLFFLPSPEIETIDERESTGPVTQRVDQTPPSFAFTDITAAAGIDMQHVNGTYGDRLLPETMGGGVAFTDLDNDGDDDLILINSGYWPWQRSDQVQPPSITLYRNDRGTFIDMTPGSGLDGDFYGMGVATGDIDQDGDTDIFVTAVGSNFLFRNDRGRFTDISEVMGVRGADDAWSTSAAFFDYDNDGDLDLIVCNYVAWSKSINEAVDYQLSGIGPAYGPPTDFAGTQSYLYRNDGSGRYTDVSAEAGIHVTGQSGAAVGKALAVLPIDVNRDGWMDLIIANDTVRNFAFINQLGERFAESGISLGVAFDTSGQATGAMGIDAVRNQRSQIAIAIGNFANEMTSFYVGHDGGAFSDDAIISGIGADSRRALTFGLLFADLNLDGYTELIAANGHVEPEINRIQSSQHYKQSLQLFWHCGRQCRKTFQPIDLTGDLARPMAGRGLTTTDLEGDGDPDLLVTTINSAPLLLRNDMPASDHWVSMKLQGMTSNQEAIGAEVTVTDAQGFKQHQQVMPSRSYLSQVSLVLTFGLPSSGAPELEVEVRWPGGDIEKWDNLPRGEHHRLIEGTGTLTGQSTL